MDRPCPCAAWPGPGRGWSSTSAGRQAAGPAGMSRPARRAGRAGAITGPARLWTDRDHARSTSSSPTTGSGSTGTPPRPARHRAAQAARSRPGLQVATHTIASGPRVSTGPTPNLTRTPLSVPVGSGTESAPRPAARHFVRTTSSVGCSRSVAHSATMEPRRLTSRPHPTRTRSSRTEPAAPSQPPRATDPNSRAIPRANSPELRHFNAERSAVVALQQGGRIRPSSLYAPMHYLMILVQ